MTIAGWVLCIIFSVGVIALCGAIFVGTSSTSIQSFVVAGGIVVCTIIFIAGFWYFNNTAAGQRQMIDQRSNLSNGLDRVVTVYTADGDVIAQYEGQIDIEANDGGYIKFDFEGKRYMYYNCFVESVADIE